MRIGDLRLPVTATKADWLPNDIWLGFSPQGKGPDAKAKCEATIQKQFDDGFILERITDTFGDPNTEYENDPMIDKERERHRGFADSLVAVHRIFYTSQPLANFIGKDEYEDLKDRWAKPANRNRWSVAFPIVETYEIIGAPKAKDVFSQEVFRRLFQTQSAGLRRLDDEARAQIADLEIEQRVAPNANIEIDAEINKAELSDISDENLSGIENDLENAMEGETEERKIKLKKRAAWLADSFAKLRKDRGQLQCDDCRFDPKDLSGFPEINQRSCFDVHHKNPLAEGVRQTTYDDLSLLCPTCHRIEHIKLKLLVTKGG